MSVKHILLATLVAIIWGSNFVVIKAGLSEAPPLTFAALRFFLVAIPAIFFIKFPPVPWVKILAIGLCTNLGQFGFLYVGMELGMPVALVGIVLQAQVLFTIAFAALFLSERIPLPVFRGVAIALIGLVIIGVFRSGTTPLIGFLLTIAAAISWSVGNVIARTVSAASGLALVVWTAAAAVPGLVVLALWWDGPAVMLTTITHLSWTGWLSTAYTVVVSTVVGYGLWNHLIGQNPANLVVRFALLIPAVSLIAAWLVYRQVPSTPELIGSGLLAMGVTATMIRPKSRAAKPAVPAPAAR